MWRRCDSGHGGTRAGKKHGCKSRKTGPLYVGPGTGPGNLEERAKTLGGKRSPRRALSRSRNKLQQDGRSRDQFEASKLMLGDPGTATEFRIFPRICRDKKLQRDFLRSQRERRREGLAIRWAPLVTDLFSATLANRIPGLPAVQRARN